MIAEDMTRVYPAKVLLFGEYGVMRNSEALIMPYDTYAGKLEDAGTVHQSIRDLFEYCQDKGFDRLNLQQRQYDIENQTISYSSSIPLSYGVGSSGALVASIYERYRLTKTQIIDTIRHHLSQMEAWFHGQSSGMDPLTSYLGQVIHKQGDNLETIKNITVPSFDLIDTGLKGCTRTNVKRFQTKLTDPSFLTSFDNEFIPHTNQAIQTLLEGDLENFWHHTRSLSERTLHHLSHLIPPAYYTHREQGLESDEYYCKLCGSGGGGFILQYNPHEVIQS